MNAVRRAPTAWVAALTLVIGFVVADATGIRAIGGVLLVLAVAIGVGGVVYALGDRTATATTAVPR